MKKVVCARCGLVNLDKFVSFPHCAACGALLVPQAPPKWRNFWRRPVRPFYWMLAVGSGLGLLGLAIASIARETRAIGDKPLLVYAQIPHDVAPGQNVTANFTLDSALENPDDNFERVSLRLNHETQHDFLVIAIKPPPTLTERRGRGRYYLWDELPRNTALQLTLQPQSNVKKGGTLRFHATLWAATYQQFEVRANIVEVSANAMELGRVSVAPNLAPIQTAPKVAR